MSKYVEIGYPIYDGMGVYPGLPIPKVTIREDLLKDIQTGSDVKVKIPALGDQSFDCTVRNVRAMASYATWRATKTLGQYDVKSFDVKVIPNTKIEGLRPGMTAILLEEN